MTEPNVWNGTSPSDDVDRLLLALAEERADRLEAGDLIADAHALQALTPGPDTRSLTEPLFRQALEVLTDSLNQEAFLTPPGRWVAADYLLRIIEQRLQLTVLDRTDPSLAQIPVRSPIIIAGPPRSGTTLLFSLLASAGGLRTPEGWELLRPVPSPRPDHYPDPARVRLAAVELGRLHRAAPNLATIHHYDARMPKECLSAMSFAGLSEEFLSRYRAPSYRRHLQHADMTSAYEMHKFVLQVLAAEMPPTRWLLKSPVHLHNLPTLFETYPDAHVVITHRDPLAIIASVTSLIATLRSISSHHVDALEIAQENAELYSRSLRRLLPDTPQTAHLPSNQVHHVTYQELISNPMRTIERLYERVGHPLTADDRDELSKTVSARSARSGGAHDYDVSRLGLDLAALRQELAEYQAHFDVPNEVDLASRC